MESLVTVQKMLKESAQHLLAMKKQKATTLMIVQEIMKPKTVIHMLQHQQQVVVLSIERKISSELHMLGEEQTLRSEEHTSELQSRFDLVCRLLLEKKK